MEVTKMSFQLLKERVIDADLCISCSLCAKNCKHISMEKLEEKPKGTPKLTGKCIMTRNGLKCGLCYNSCPIVKKNIRKNEKAFYTTQQQIEVIFNDQNQHTITEVAKNIAVSAKDVRYEILRLVQRGNLHMKVDPELTEAFFWK